jgi:c-di-GMP-binding flagellar brake protein YcgR
MANGSVERRRYPRAAIDYRGVLETTSGDEVNLRTRNISGSGIYFDAEKRLTDFTEVSLTVALPPVGTAKALSFSCRGVVVRVEVKRDDSGWPFSAAVHFTEIEERHRGAVCAYVDAVLAERRKARREEAAG